MSKLTLDNVEWKEFYFSDIFEQIYIAPSSDSNKLEKGEVVFIGRSSTNNGLQDFVEVNGKKIIKGNCITISMVGEPRAFYQVYDFTCSQNILILRNDKYLNKNISLYLSSLIDNYLKSKGYGYGYPVGLKRVLRNKLLLPITSDGSPNWQFMEDYIKQEMKAQSQKIITYYENKLMKLGFELLDLEVEWKEFFFTDIFKEIKRGKRLTKSNQIDGNIPYVSSTGINNGVDNFIGNDEKVRKYANNLSLANSGSVGSCFYHKYEYIASDHITALTSDYADEYVYKFMSTIISRLEEKYSFNREINDKRISREKLFLPIDKNDEPHWKYMSNFIKELEKENIEKTLNHIYIYIIAKKLENKYLLTNTLWKEFFIEDICEIKSGKDIYERDRIEGQTPYVTATANNNGIGYFISNTNTTLQEKCISVNRNGSVGYSFYHSYPALFGNDTRKLIPKYEDAHVAKFISFMISSQKEKYGYGYKMGTARLKRQKILLPINEDESINYEFMKKYIIIQEIISIYSILDYYKQN